jgi:hypothetical protein
MIKGVDGQRPSPFLYILWYSLGTKTEKTKQPIALPPKESSVGFKKETPMLR